MGLSVLIHGLGVEGRAAVRYFAGQGVRPLTHDAGDAAHPDADALGADAVRDALGPGTLYLRSPGIVPSDPLYRAACASGARVTTPTGWWLARHAPPGAIGITGTKGKSTTTALTAAALRAGGAASAAYGNIGAPVLDADLPSEAAPVVELSSYMCADLIAPEDGRRWRHALTNLYKEHTTWHGTEAAYRAAKLRPYRFAPPCPGVAPAETIADEGLPDAVTAIEDAARLDGAVLTIDGRDLRLDRLSEAFRAPGLRLAARAAAAILLPVLGDEASDALAEAGRSWTGLPSRQAIVPSADGRAWIDDALATVPEAVSQALDRFGDRAVRLVLGGLDRGQDLTSLLTRVDTLPDACAYGFGAVSGQVARGGWPIFATLEDAVRAAREDCPEGGVVLFSPAAPSGPPHRDYRERAAVFAALAAEA